MANGSRRRIQGALFSLLEEWPLESITVSEVVSRAGVSRTTYYRLYDSLEDVVDDALDELFAEVAPLAAGANGDGEPSERLTELAVYQMLCCYKRDVDVLCLLMRGNAGMLFQRRLYGFVLEQIGKYSARPEAAPIDTMRKAYVAAGMTAVICRWVANRCAEPVEDMLEFVMKARLAPVFE